MRPIRILFVDDQREVAKTLSGLLAKDNVEFRFAEDGETGFARLKTEIFDLAVIDLRMPPGHWGGLWLLRELSDYGLLIDTLVLSGEAGQAETIEAIRLGALDFVVKDNASTELTQRVREVLANRAEARSIYAANQLPTPLALPYQRMGVNKDQEAQLRASLATAESIVRFCALAAVAMVRANGTLDESLIARLSRPSFGTWLDVCRRLQPQVGDHALGRWIQAACGKDADTIVRHRNDTVHGGGVPAAGLQHALGDVLGWHDFFVLAAQSGTTVELLVAGQMAFNGITYNAEVARLAGIARSVAWTHIGVSAPLVMGKVYLHSSTEEYLDMWPLILAENGESVGDWDVAIMDGFRETHRGEIAISDRLRYVNASTGARFTSTDRVVGDLM